MDTTLSHNREQLLEEPISLDEDTTTIRTIEIQIPNTIHKYHNLKNDIIKAGRPRIRLYFKVTIKKTHVRG